tara:strand:+ start:2716 stop:3018 length:303 start_codon:yes stop_codon:yes gene_type:complete
MILESLRLLKMDKEILYDLLSTSYEEAIDIDKAWSLYNNFDELCINGDFTTILYVYKICMMDKRDRLRWRTRLAELGFELTPNEVDQYLLILTIVLTSAI